MTKSGTLVFYDNIASQFRTTISKLHQNKTPKKTPVSHILIRSPNLDPIYDIY